MLKLLTSNSRPDRRGEHLNYAGAQRLARSIEQFWLERGYITVRCFVEEAKYRYRTEAGQSAGIYQIRSNLIAGLPPVAP